MPDYLYNDFINAELLLPLFLHKEITVNFVGDFARTYSPDIRSIVLNKAVAQLTLHRNGLYHQLPEGMFHDADSPLDMGGMEAVANTSRHLKQEVAMACRFFQPMEQLLFEQRCMISNISMYPVLMNLLQAITGCKEEAFLKLLIPFLSEIRNCKSVQTAIVLISRIIEQPVSFSWKSVGRSTGMLVSKAGMVAELGLNLILGNIDGEEISMLSIKVGPVAVLDAPAYLPGNRKGRFLRLLGYLLLPAVIEIDWQLLIEKEDHICTLGGYIYC